VQFEFTGSSPIDSRPPPLGSSRSQDSKDVLFDLFSVIIDRVMDGWMFGSHPLNPLSGCDRTFRDSNFKCQTVSNSSQEKGCVR